MAKKKKDDTDERTPEQKIIDKAVKRLKICVEADAHNRDAAIDDLKFVNGEQWDDGEKRRRKVKNRPVLQINLLPKFVDQVVGDMLHNCPSLKVRPIDSKGDINIAKIRQGIISNIEYLSNAPSVYGYAARQQVSCGYGAWRVLTRYTEENPFLQEAYIESIRNPFLAFLDPRAKDQNGLDAKYGFIIEKVPTKEFEDRFPDAETTLSDIKTGRGMADEMWYDSDNVTVAEYFELVEEDVELYQLEDGTVVTDEQFKELKKQWKERNEEVSNTVAHLGAPQDAPPQPPQGQQPPPQGSPAGAVPPGAQVPPPGQGGPKPPQQGAQSPGQSPKAPEPPPLTPQQEDIMAMVKSVENEPKIAQKRKSKQSVLKHRIITGSEILEGGEEGKTFPGTIVPIVILKGKELNIEGKNYVYSLIRHAKDPQKLVNYWNSAAAESIALAPKAPWIGTARQFEGYENDYALANVDNFPMLKYNADPEASGPPQRNQPPAPPVAMFEQIRRGEDNIKSVIGMFNADVGAGGSEQTGAAITARQKPGDISTFEFSVNLSRAILHTGRILNGIIPAIYDSERDVRLRNIDETETFVPVNTSVGKALKAMDKTPTAYQGLERDKLINLMKSDGADARFNDITAGKYDCVITTGPNYATQRQESAQQLLALAQAMPQQMSMALDLIVKNMDFKEADELSNRLKKMLPPGMIKPKEGDPPQQLPPQVLIAQAKMSVEQGRVQLAQMKVEQEKLKLEHEKIKMQGEIEKTKLELEARYGNRNKSEATGEPQDDRPLRIDALEKDRKYDLEQGRLQLETERLKHQKEMDRIKLIQESTKNATKNR